MPKLAQLRTAIYARTSTLDQDPGMQLRELRAYAEHRGLPITEAFIDDVTGATAECRQLDRLWQAVRARKVDAVLVDRGVRALAHLGAPARWHRQSPGQWQAPWPAKDRRADHPGDPSPGTDNGNPSFNVEGTWPKFCPSLPQGHFTWTNEETIVQLHGVGPWAITYVNPADDPRKP
jgi:Resolvase, N terminal domain